MRIPQPILREGQAARLVGVDVGLGRGVNEREFVGSDVDDFAVLGMEDREVFEDSTSQVGKLVGDARCIMYARVKGRGKERGRGGGNSRARVLLGESRS